MGYKRIDPEKVAREVLEAITSGHATFSKIQQQTRRTADRVSDALALLLNKNRIRIQKRDGARCYLPAARAPQQRRADPRSSQSEPAPALSFSALRGLMPSRITTATHNGSE